MQQLRRPCRQKRECSILAKEKTKKKKKTRLKNLGEKLNYDVKKVARIQGWTKGTYYQAVFFFLIKTM